MRDVANTLLVLQDFCSSRRFAAMPRRKKSGDRGIAGEQSTLGAPAGFLALAEQCARLQRGCKTSLQDLLVAPITAFIERCRALAGIDGSRRAAVGRTGPALTARRAAGRSVCRRAASVRLGLWNDTPGD